MKKWVCIVFAIIFSSIITLQSLAFDDIKYGDYSYEVADVQQLLIDAGYRQAVEGVDGHFGNGTEQEVKSFQSDNNLEITGVVDEKTYNVLKFGTSENDYLDKYSAGQYKVGQDIPAGEYFLFAESGKSGYFCVSTDGNQNDIIENDNFDYNSIITVYNGTYFEFKRSYAVPLFKVSNDDIDVSGSGFFKIGLHIPAGEYKLEADSGRTGYYAIFNNSTHEDIISNNNFDANQYVTVYDGQYLQLNRCRIVPTPQKLADSLTDNNSNSQPIADNSNIETSYFNSGNYCTVEDFVSRFNVNLLALRLYGYAENINFISESDVKRGTVAITPTVSLETKVSDDNMVEELSMVIYTTDFDDDDEAGDITAILQSTLYGISNDSDFTSSFFESFFSMDLTGMDSHEEYYNNYKYSLSLMLIILKLDIVAQ